MLDVLVVVDKRRRRIRLSRERWKHITGEHPDVVDVDEVKDALLKPVRVKSSTYDPEHVVWFYRYNKERKRYLFVSVKFLNGEGFIITAYHMRSIK